MTKGATEVIEAMYDVIASTGKDGIPSGHLYAGIMGKVSIDTYQAIIDILVETGKITNTGHLLKSL